MLAKHFVSIAQHTVYCNAAIVDCSCAGLRRVCAPARKGIATDNIPMFDANSAHQWISCCAEAASVAPGTSQFSGVTGT